MNEVVTENSHVTRVEYKHRKFSRIQGSSPGEYWAALIRQLQFDPVARYLLLRSTIFVFIFCFHLLFSSQEAA
jgi:hypothetical protein